jgi:hypothetical protein
MLRTNLWNDSASSRVALDQRAREAHLQLERIERLLVPRAPVTPSRRWRLLGLLRSVFHTASGKLAEPGCRLEIGSLCALGQFLRSGPN